MHEGQARGYTCRLLVSGGRNRDGSVSAYVEPVLFRSGAPECSVLENYNMAKYEGKNSGRIVLMGQGAGRYPTASAVLRDLSGILRGERYMFAEDCEEASAENAETRHCYYIRLPAAFVDSVPAESVETDGAVGRVISREMSVKEMHALAKKLREKGANVFFAAVGE